MLDDYPKCFIVGADNVGSQQMQQIRISLRGSSIVLMGKNTMMRKAIKDHLETNPALEKLLPHIKGNVGFVFTRGDLVEVRVISFIVFNSKDVCFNTRGLYIGLLASLSDEIKFFKFILV